MTSLLIIGLNSSFLIFAKKYIPFGAGGGGRTRTVLLPPDFESGTSANSITPAYIQFSDFESGTVRSSDSVMNDSPVDCQNRSGTEPAGEKPIPSHRHIFSFRILSPGRCEAAIRW